MLTADRRRWLALAAWGVIAAVLLRIVSGGGSLVGVGYVLRHEPEIVVAVGGTTTTTIRRAVFFEAGAMCLLTMLPPTNVRQAANALVAHPDGSLSQADRPVFLPLHLAGTGDRGPGPSLIPPAPRPPAAVPAVATLPAWAQALLDPTRPLPPGTVVPAATEPTVRGEFARAVRQAGLGADEDLVLRAGLLALDGRLGTEAG